MRLLVVDDDIIIRHYFVRTLRRHVDVEEASRLDEALAKVRSSPFDAVLTDERLPDGGGRVLLVQASLLQPRCRRLLMSVEPAATENGRPYERSFTKVGGLPQAVMWIRALASPDR
ncbi:MAG: response regulator [Labilithrix sp.]|nr:response regulator [Labilithrix sp.]MBX3215421.1 response regulator [Labilithrix sp.]